MGEIIFLLISAVLIVACGLFVAAEFALITVDRATVQRKAREGDKAAHGVDMALSSLSTQLSGAQVGITITNLAIGYLAQPSLTTLIEGPLKYIGVHGAAVSGVSVVLALLLATAATMIFGELVPKNLAIAMPLETAKSIQQFQRTFSWIMTYPIRLCNGTANAILRRMGIEPREELASARSAEELSSIVRRSADKGTLPKEMALMLERSLTFGERRADEVMTPRARVESVQSSDTAAIVIEKARSSGFSRFPVTGKDIDDVIGVVHVKHAVSIAQQKRDSTLVKKIMKKPIFVPSNLQLDPLMEMLRKGGLQMAIVIDEFGGTDGIVTVEDLIEELVGEVRDEHDKADVVPRKIKPDVWILPGLLRPDEASQFIGVAFPEEEEFETLGGLISERLEHVPKKLDEVEITVVDRNGQERSMRLKVTSMDGHRVEKIRANIMHQRPGESNG